jgi:hypothetical protein
VYHGEHGLRTLKELGRSYLTITKDVTRVMNRIKALYRSWAIPCVGTSVYAPRHRAEWLAKIEQPGVRVRAEHLYQQRMLRRLLVGSSQYMLGAFGPDTDLRRYGLRLCERGGKNAKKRAVVAVARKLAVLLHHLWVTGDIYEPLHHTGTETRTAQATAA